jgi:hypothetical protein
MKTNSDTATLSRSGSTSSRKGDASPARRPRPKKGVVDGGDGPNPDPAVFEAAFVIDDSEEPSRAGTPKPPSDNKDAGDDKPAAEPNDPDGKLPAKGEATNDKAEDAAGEAIGAASKKPDSGTATPISELSPEIKQRLRKLDKLEATYPGWYPSDALQCKD